MQGTKACMGCTSLCLDAVFFYCKLFLLLFGILLYHWLDTTHEIVLKGLKSWIFVANVCTNVCQLSSLTAFQI